MKIYILGPAEEDLKNLIQKGSREVLESLRIAHPKALTTKDLIEQTGEAESTIYASISNLKRDNYIKKIDEISSGPGRPKKNAMDNRTSKYIVEDGNYWMSKKYGYKLSRGNTDFDAEFLIVSDRILEKLNLSPFFDNLLLVARDLQSLIKDQDEKDFQKWAPLRGKETICPNCKVNHELRDYLRAMLLRLLDKFESDERYTNYLTENVSNGMIEPSSVITGYSLIKSDTQNREQPTEIITLRVLSIEKNIRNNKYELLAIDENKNIVYVDVDSTLVTVKIVPDSIVECFTNNGYLNPADVLCIEVSKENNHSIKRVAEISTFPKARDIITDIGLIIPKSIKEGEIFNIEGIITQLSFLKSDKHSINNSAITILLRDNTGMIPIKLNSKYSNKFHEGDKILVLGAEVNESLGLNVDHYSSVTKTGSIIITNRNPPYQNDIYYKHFEVNRKLVQEMISVSLTDIIISNSRTRVFIMIENVGEEDLDLYMPPHRYIAIQNKTQFIAKKVLYKNTEIYSPPSIPPAIAEKFIIEFEGVDPTQPILSFRLAIGRAGQTKNYFKFTAQIPH